MKENLLKKIALETKKIKDKTQFEKQISSPDLLHTVTNKLGMSPRLNKKTLSSFPLMGDHKRKIVR